MEARATGKYFRSSAIKIRKVINPVRGKSVEEALAIFKILPNKAAKIAYKVLHSARANYINMLRENGGSESDVEGIMIKEIFANEGPILRRMRPRARGRADIIRKQMSHLTVVIGKDEKQVDKDEE